MCLRDILGFLPHNIDFYKTALLHKSIARRNEKGKPVNNERLEFLGDAILDAVVADIVYTHFPGKREGFLTNTRSKLVQRETLNKLAQEMGINQLILSSGKGNAHNSYMGGNAFEALVGAIYLDQGYQACVKFMQKRILAQMINIDKVAYKEVNFKSKLIEWSQKNRVNIDFKLVQQDKDKNGSPIFEHLVIIEGENGCSATGYSKKESQQQAAKKTLEKLRKEPQFIKKIFAAKSNRTKMEEEPVESIPNTDAKTDFIISQNEDKSTNGSKHETVFKEEVFDQKGKQKTPSPQQKEKKNSSNDSQLTNDEFDLSDISLADKKKEDIIAAAEAAAFAEL